MSFLSARYGENQAMRLAVALGIGGCGAGAALVLSLPAPFLTGPAIAVTLAGLAGVAMEVPARVRDAAFVVLGVSMGTAVTPDVLVAARTWPLSFVMLFAALVAILWASRSMMARWWGADRRTAVLSAAPGHLSYVLGLADANGLDIRMIAIVQSIRVLLLTLAVPPLVILMESDLAAVAPPRAAMAPGWLAATLAAAAIAGLFLKRVRLPAAYLLGGMAVSTGTHLGGIVGGHVPQALVIPAYVLLGTLIGTRFSGVSPGELRAAATAGLALTGMAVTIALIFAFGAASLTGLPLDQTLIAFAPGGVETMSAMALLMHADPTFVAAHHVSRLFFLTFLIPLSLGRNDSAG